MKLMLSLAVFTTSYDLKRSEPHVGLHPVSGERTRNLKSLQMCYQVGGPRFESQSGPSQFFISPLCPPSSKWFPRFTRPLEKRRGIVIVTDRLSHVCYCSCNDFTATPSCRSAASEQRELLVAIQH
ncbi:hypothetical protein PoB_004461600 [Plakobranchus ocellatus]|uniref:Secreted protein n=1 Tax=Plakobranchus ocellatus TaxID=259542 RepID=A0AAV4BCG1_9GAST|nr:hypothetical protein PoB_004461600 [Plakobranchus ocellatus]